MSSFGASSTFTTTSRSSIGTSFATRATLATAPIVSTIFATGPSRRTIAPSPTRFTITQLRLRGLMSGVAFRRCSFRFSLGNLERLGQGWLRRCFLRRRSLLCFGWRRFRCCKLRFCSWRLCI